MVQNLSAALEEEVRRLHAVGDISRADSIELTNRVHNAIDLLMGVMAEIRRRRQTPTP